jgi:O-antigen ligase
MLFIPLTVLILYSLATFGAVQPKDWWLIGIILTVVLVVFLINSALRQSSWRYSLLLTFGCAVISVGILRSHFFISLTAGLLAWVAASDGGRQNVLRFLKSLVVIGVAEAVLGIAQYLVSPGWIFGYVNTAYRVSGTLINRNHFAGLLEMLIPVTFGLAYIAATRFDDLARSYTYLLAGAVMGLALILSTSRMGILSFFTTVLFLGILLRVSRSRRRLAVGFTLTMVGLVVAAALWIGIDVVIQRYSELLGEDAILREGRFLVYSDTIRMIRANPLGVGIGNFEDRFREYQTYRPNLLFDHAHNDYLESAAEWGIPIAAIFWILVILVFGRSVRLFVSLRSPEQRGILLACIGAVFSILIHSLTDFNLQIPSNAILFFAFVGLSLALPIRDVERKTVHSAD